MTDPLRSALARPEWQIDAACNGLDVKMFYSAKDSPLTAAAKRVCASCSVSKECLAWAEANGEQGVWGGKMFDRPDRLR